MAVLGWLLSEYFYKSMQQSENIKMNKLNDANIVKWFNDKYEFDKENYISLTNVWEQFYETRLHYHYNKMINTEFFKWMPEGNFYEYIKTHEYFKSFYYKINDNAPLLLGWKQKTKKP